MVIIFVLAPILTYWLFSQGFIIPSIIAAFACVCGFASFITSGRNIEKRNF